MGLVYKQLLKSIIKDSVFLFLLFLLTTLTALSFFFVTASVDGNSKVLNELEHLSVHQQKYQNALHSNRILAYAFWLSLVSLTTVALIMFFYRFFRANAKEIGCLKTLGFRNRCLQLFFVVFTAALSVLGAIFGLFGGYGLSDILIKANEKTYDVTGLIKGISGFSLIIGFVDSTVIFCVTALLCYGFMRNREDGFQNRFPVPLQIANKLSRIAPAHKRLSLRIALRKPLSVLLLLVSVMSFQVCIILGQSLHLSSAKVFHMQTTGHNYAYQIQYEKYRTSDTLRNAMTYIDKPSLIMINDYELERIVTGLYGINELYELKNKNNALLTVPNAGCVYINPELSEIYGVKVGDLLVISIADLQVGLKVEDIAVNAQTNHIYMNGKQLAELLHITAGAYNGAFSAKRLEGGMVVSEEQRIEEMNRNFVSNKTSAVINQATGVLVGIILIFLALHISLQDNVHDILILRMLGHSISDIRKLLVNIYLPVLRVLFVISLVPSILLARTIQNTLSISTNDYMPFGINFGVIIIAFGLINLIYYGIEKFLELRVRHIIEKEDVTEIIYSE